jgi:hypothetical protein
MTSGKGGSASAGPPTSNPEFFKPCGWGGADDPRKHPFPGPAGHEFPECLRLCVRCWWRETHRRERESARPCDHCGSWDAVGPADAVFRPGAVLCRRCWWEFR